MKTCARIDSSRLTPALGVLVCAFVAFLSGCDVEVEPTGNFQITVAPKTVSLKKGESQEFVASGGLTYTWSLEGTGTWAILSAQTGESVIYTSLMSDTGTTLRILTVTSTLGGTSSNSTELTASDEAYISHIP